MQLLTRCVQDQTSVHDVTVLRVQVQVLLAHLVLQDDRSILDAFLQGLAPSVLADVVIANMQFLPVRPPRLFTAGS